nr:MAG TPA: hypothetical protein [Caudoviricetes sp.]
MLNLKSATQGHGDVLKSLCVICVKGDKNEN